jgi:hypothetical protein
MTGDRKITCAKLQEAAARKADGFQTRDDTVSILNKIIATRQNEEKIKMLRDHGVYQA